jgi:lipoyl(octanoyl) transferase
VSKTPELLVVRPGLVGYADSVAAQQASAAARAEDAVPDVLLLLEHPPVLTRGRRSGASDLPMGEDWYRMQGIEVLGTDRGGQVTYHGPGQLVAYPIVDLAAVGGGKPDVTAYVRGLERVMIAALGENGVSAQVFDGLTGVWTAGEPPVATGEIGPQRTAVGAASLPGGEARKIGSIGIHVSHGVTTHGLAVNVSNDLQPFDWVVTCGIESVRMTSLSRELGSSANTGEFASTIATRLCAEFDRVPREITVGELVELVPGASPLAAATIPVL